jgi:Aldehyde dehydrogenase family
MRQLVTIPGAIAMIALAACTHAPGPQGPPGPVRPARRARKASKDPSVPRAPWGSRGQLALRDRRDQLDRRDRRGKPVDKAQLDPPANGGHQGLRARLAHPVPPDQRVPRVTPALPRQFASSMERIAFAAKTTKSWLVLFARAVRPTERSARPVPSENHIRTQRWCSPDKRRKSSDGGRFDVLDPATENKIASVASATVEDAKAAVDAASAAFEGWAGRKPRERAEVLRKSFELIMRDAERLAKLITIENGKALPDSRGEVAYGAEFFRWYAEEAVRAIGEVSRAPASGARMVVQHKPAGLPKLYAHPFRSDRACRRYRRGSRAARRPAHHPRRRCLRCGSTLCAHARPRVTGPALGVARR